MTYRPAPIDTTAVSLPTELHALIERLSENAHEVWGEKRMSEGWTYGAQRNDDAKKHPCLVPYAELSEAERDIDRKMVLGALKAIVALGYRILPPEKN